MPLDATMQIPVLLQASRIGTLDEAARTVDVIFSTGARVMHPMPGSPGMKVMTQAVVTPEAAMLDTLNSGAPVLRDHDHWSTDSIIGCVEQAWIEKGVAMARLRISAAAGVADDWTKISEGVAVQWSMSFRTHAVEIVPDPERPGEDLWLLTRWEPVEISLVPIGADPGAKTQGAAPATCTATIIHQSKEGVMPEANPNTMTPEAAVITPQSAAPTSAPALDVKAIAKQAQQDERARAAAIRDAAPALDAGDDLVKQAIDGGLTVEAFRARAVEAFVAQRQAATRGIGGPAASVTADASERFRQGAELGLLARCGMKGGERNEFTSLSLRELARQSLSISAPGRSFTDARDMVGAAFTQSGAHSTSDFANILSNIMGKAALIGWDEAEETFQLWTSVGTLTDFKPTKRVGLGNFTTLSLKEEGGEYSLGTAGDRGESLTLATYGKMLRITREAIINDDLQLLSDLPRKMGRAAKRTIGNLAYAVLSDNAALRDGVALFHATHKNLSGSAAAPSVASLSAAEAAMMVQTEATGAATVVNADNPALNIRPRYILVPPSLKRSTVQLMTSPVDPTATKGMASNPVAGLAEVISDGRMTGTAWYLAADPSMHDTIEVAYLNGQSEPYIEQTESWSTDGVKMKVRIDAAVGPRDHRALYKNAGA
jgi:hypothetical protein